MEDESADDVSSSTSSAHSTEPSSVPAWGEETVTPQYEDNGNGEGKAVPMRNIGPGILAISNPLMHESYVDLTDKEQLGDKAAVGAVALYWVGSVVLALAMVLLPLSPPQPKLVDNWMYVFVWFPIGVSVVAATFDAFADVLFSEVHRPAGVRAAVAALYVVSAEAALLVAVAFDGFPTVWTVVPVVLCLLDFVALWFTFPADVRAREHFGARFKLFFVLSVLLPSMFLVQIVFTVRFSSLSATAQAIALLVFVFGNFWVRNAMMLLSAAVNPRSRHIGAFFQEYLTSFTLMLAVPNTASLSIYLLTLALNLFPLAAYPLRLTVPLVTAQHYAEHHAHSLLRTCYARTCAPAGGSAAAFEYPPLKPLSEGRLRRYRENIFRSFVLVGSCEIYAATAFAAIFPAMAFGPQATYFTYITNLSATEVATAVVYSLVTAGCAFVTVSIVVVGLAVFYFPENWVRLVKQVVASTPRHGAFYFFAMSLCYLLAYCILGTHYGASEFVGVITGGK